MRAKYLKSIVKLAVEKDFNLLITGAPGIGKTEIVRTVADDLTTGIEGAWTMVLHPVVSTPTDFSGLGFPSEDRTHAQMLPYGNLHRMLQPTPLGIVIIDDMGQASSAVQAALMQLVQERSINGLEINKNVRFILLTNRKEDKAGVSAVLYPLISRCTCIALEVNADDWLLWAAGAGMPAELIAFMKLRPERLWEQKKANDISNVASPRNVAEVGRWQLAGVPEPLEYEIFSGRCGEGWAAEYAAFLKTYREMEDPELWLADPGKALPSDISRLYALCSALAYRASKKNVEAIFKVAMRLDGEFSTFLVFSMLARDKKLAQTAGMARWTEKFSDYLL